ARSGNGSWNGIVMSAFSANPRRILSLWLPRLPIDRIRRQLCGTTLSNETGTGSRSCLPSPGGGGSARGARSATRDGVGCAARNTGGDASDEQSPHHDRYAVDPPPPGEGDPSIVIAKQNNALQIYAMDDAAARLGLEIGLPLANARAICPDIKVFDADPAADLKTLNDIADWCDRFTPLVALDPPHGLFLDITGCAHLFGGEAALLQAICTALTRQGFAVSAAIAANSVCARTIRSHAHGRIVRSGEEASAVSPLPLFALGADEAIIRGLRRDGLKTIGDVASRERHEITARFGASFTKLLEQALGQGEAPISPRKPLPDYIVEKRFAEPVATEDVIAASLSSLAQMLVAAMDKQGKGARQLEASFFRTDGAVR